VTDLLLYHCDKLGRDRSLRRAPAVDESFVRHAFGLRSL